MKYPLKLTAVFACVCALFSVAHMPLLHAKEGSYSFKVHNTTKEKITGLLASEDGKTYGKFDVGEGIEPDGTMTLAWDKSTEKSGCHWFFKAVYEGGDESEPAEFNFCEENLVLEF
ncbi:MAG: hypothetical protein ABI946_10870 [Chthoniobacterales bacterium]